MEPAALRRTAEAVEREVARAVVGQERAVRGVLVALLAGGHALLEGVPGLGKTTMVRAFADAFGLAMRRIQFTPDLLPADITGTTVLDVGAGVGAGAGAGAPRFVAGPLFAPLVLADEVNRASPRTQSALLEAMQERTVTVGVKTHPLPAPFCVLATQNPVELHGTYPLPEAELDRFLLHIAVGYPSLAELNALVARTTGAEDAAVAAVSSAGELQAMQALVREVPAASHVVDYASRLVLALQPGEVDAVRLGPSPRGAQALCLAGRVVALLDGRRSLAFSDVRAVAHDALRHRLALSFAAEREGVTADALIDAALERVPEEP